MQSCRGSVPQDLSSAVPSVSFRQSRIALFGQAAPVIVAHAFSSKREDFAMISQIFKTVR
jgi:hypothetical protein